jgi:hypothetical protein
MRVSLRVARRAKAGLASVVLPGIAAILLGLLLPSSGLAQEQGHPNPQVVSPHTVPFGKSYGEWGAAWWNWAFSSPVEINSVVDETGEFCDVNQSGPVWFLAGISGFVPPADVPLERECTVPAGKALFFPILNSFCVDEGDGSEEAQRACARPFVDTATVLEASVDGRPLTGLSKYRGVPRLRAASPDRGHHRSTVRDLGGSRAGGRRRVLDHAGASPRRRARDPFPGSHARF